MEWNLVRLIRHTFFTDDRHIFTINLNPMSKVLLMQSIIESTQIMRI